MSSPGQEVAAGEDLYRVLSDNRWFKAEENRVSSAAFCYDKVSTDAVSIADNQGRPPTEHTLSRFPAGVGLVVLNVGFASSVGCATKLEPEHGNPAHAHLYMPAGNRRKSAQKKLAEHCKLLKKPELPDAS